MQDPTQAINPGNTATADQYAQMLAIQQLLGDKTPQGAAINPLNSAQAGSYNPANLNQFNYDAALKDIQNYNTQSVQAAKDEAQALTNQADLGHAQGQHTGGFLGGIEQAVTHPLNTIASVSNPTTWAANAQNILKGQGPSPTNVDPLNPQNSGTPVTPQYIKQTASDAAKVAAIVALTAGTGGAGAPAAAGATAVPTAGEAGTTAATTGANGTAGLPVLMQAHGGEVPDVESYLDKKHTKAEVK
jgi:hypothetical protein